MARLILAAGGTGGHVYPALAVAEALRKSADDAHELTFVGTRGGGGFEQRLVEQAAVHIDHYADVFAGPIVGVNPLRMLRSVGNISVGVAQSFAIIRRYHPQAILLTGGWANVPLALAAATLRVPMLVYLPDIEPGSTIKVLARIVDKVAITVDASEQYFRQGLTVVTGYPIRQTVLNANRDAAIDFFNLDSARKTILVTGGSRGARNINIAVETVLPELLQHNAQVIHITGKLDYERSQEQTMNLADKTHYHAYNYLDSPEMGMAFAASDIIVGRSGASVLGEFPYFGAASILIPYPYAWRYQKVNADWLVDKGAGIRVNDDEQLADKLGSTLRDLLHDEHKLQAMQQRARGLHSGNGAQNIAAELLKLAGDTTR